MAQNITVFTRAWLGFICVHDQIMWTRANLFGHEGPFKARWETRAAASAKARGFSLINQPIFTLCQHRSCTNPCAAFLRRLKPPILKAIEVLENTVFILEKFSHYALPFFAAGLGFIARGFPPFASALPCFTHSSRLIRPGKRERASASTSLMSAAFQAPIWRK